MSRYLLDTHTLIWWLNGSPQLPQPIRAGLDQAELIHVSAASITDAYHLTRKRRDGLTMEQWRALVDQLLDWPDDLIPLELEPITADVALLAALLREMTGITDPADLYLAATAARLRLPLVSRDEELTSWDGLGGVLEVRWESPTATSTWAWPTSTR